MMSVDAPSKKLGSRFWKLFTSTAVSNLADGIGNSVVPLLATTVTRNPVLIASLTSLAYLPWLLMALPSGAFVDRSDRRRVMVGANLFRAGAYGALAAMVAFHLTTIWLLYVVAFALGVAETLYDSAVRAILPQVIARNQLDRANSLLATVESGAQTFIGAPIGALLFAAVAVLPLVTNASAFVLAALLMAAIAGHFRPTRAVQSSSLGADIRDGVSWLWRHHFLRGLTMVNGVTSALQSMANAVVVLYALEVVHLAPAAYGIVLVATGLGALLGGLVTPWIIARLGRITTLSVTSVLFPMPLAAMSLTSNAVVGCALYGLSAMLVMSGNVLTMSLRQTMISEELFGRVQGAYRTLVWGGIPVGAFAGGVLASLTNVRTVFAFAGLAAIPVGFWMSALLRRHRVEIDQAYQPEHETVEA
jgi:MFS family permease